MARPTDHNKHRSLAKRAVEVLQRRGVQISMAELARELEVKRPTLLYHFASLSHLVEFALEELLVEQMQFVLAQVANHEHPVDRIYAQLRAVHAFHDGNEARIVFLSQAIATSAGERMDNIIEVGNRVFLAGREAAAERLRQGIREGSVQACDVDALMVLLRGLTDGLLLQRVMTGVDLAPAHEMLWQTLLAPLKTQSCSASSPPPQQHSFIQTTEASP